MLKELLVKEYNQVVEEIALGYIPPARFFEYNRHGIKDLEEYRNKLIELIAQK